MLCVPLYDGQINGKMLMTLRTAGDDICVLISSYSATAEDENTASIIRVLVCV